LTLRTGSRFPADDEAFYCKAFGIKPPKSKGVTDMDAANLPAGGKPEKIAGHCPRDVHAT
jgi:hypothetical protein